MIEDVISLLAIIYAADSTVVRDPYSYILVTFAYFWSDRNKCVI